jgi:hypothetical protein
MVLLVSRCEFSEISKVVALHLEEEHLGLRVLRVGNEGVIEQSQDVIANVF